MWTAIIFELEVSLAYVELPFWLSPNVCLMLPRDTVIKCLLPWFLFSGSAQNARAKTCKKQKASNSLF
jgi:hypothetical protein